jgi:hypothetical protein
LRTQAGGYESPQKSEAYYRGFTKLPILLGMEDFRPCFLVVALYQGNYLAIIMSLVTGAVHVDLTYGNFAEV